MNTDSYYQIKSDQTSFLSGPNGQHTFSTKEEAVGIAKAFKENPRSHNSKMSDENVASWKSKTYTVIQKIVITEVVEKI